MDFDQMLETWCAHKTASLYDVNRDHLRQALQTEDARVRRALRTRRHELWFLWILGTGMAVWAGFWIAITITNGWSAIYAIVAGVSFGMFALGVGASWASRGRQPEERNFGDTLQGEMRRSLALVDYQLSVARRWIPFVLGSALIVVGTGPFSWTLVRSQDIPESIPNGWWWYTVLLVAFFVRACYNARNEMRNTKTKLETRQRRLSELLAALDALE